VGTHSQALTNKPVLIIGRKGSVGQVYYSKQPCWPIDTVYFVEESEGIQLGFFEYLLRGLNLSQLDKSTAVPGLSRDDYNAIEVAVAPFDQQKRIVAEIEKQFSRLDEAVANLKRVKANLKRYKAAVLKAALEGKLTEDWRKQHLDVERASELLKRVLAERRTRWNGKGKYKEPKAPGIVGLPALPEGWLWARLDAVAALKGGITVDKNRKSAHARMIPYLRVANVQRGYLDLAEVKKIEAPGTDINELRLESGDVLFTEGGDRDKLGRGWIWEGQLAECIHQNHVFRARLYSHDVSPKLISWWGNSFGQKYFMREGKQTTNLASVNLTKLSEFPIPVPSRDEQRFICEEVELRFSVIEELKVAVEANLERAERMRQAILRRAFLGELISDD
jgi:type I restriction enzyme, S subunit